MSTHRPHPHQAYAPYAPQYAPPAPRNGLGIAALILGLVGLPFFLTGLTAPIAIVLGLIAIPLALTGRGPAKSRRTACRSDDTPVMM